MCYGHQFFTTLFVVLPEYQSVFTKGNARNFYLKLRMSVVFQPNDPSSDCARMTGWKGNPSEASEQQWTLLAARLNDLKGNLLKSNTRWPLWHKDRGASCAGDSGRCILKHQEEVQWSRNVSPRFSRISAIWWRKDASFDWWETSVNPSMTSFDARLEATKAR